MIKFKMHTTEEYDRLIRFFIDNGLEFDEGEEDRSDILKCWKITQEGDYLIAACMLVMREGNFVVEGVAVDPVFRKCGLGKILMDKALEEVKERGGKELLLMARKPEFYKKLNFEIVKPDDAPPIFDCLGCPQYGKDCFPEIMKYTLP